MTALAPDLRAYPAPPRVLSPADIHLQWFASPEEEGRTEEPSEYKLRKAREEGRVAKSQDLVAAIGLLLTAVTLAILAPWMLQTLREMIVRFLKLSTESDIVTDGALAAGLFFRYLLRLLLPLASVGVLAALFGNILQVGFLFSVKPITPDFKKVVPRLGQYFQRIFSMEGLYNLGKSILKIAIISTVAWILVNGELERLRNLYMAPFWTSVKLVSGMILKLILAVAVTLLALSIPDYMFQRRQFLERMKMTKQEVKEERKMHEGDPQVKGRLRERMRDLLTRNMAVNVPKADVVITNPTHFAVALEWDRESMAAPMVTAKGMDEAALRIRRIAEDARVPVVENRPLARALYAETEIGQTIPEKYYQAIAAVLAHVYALSDKGRRYARAAGAEDLA
ncbi:MAG TPA: flagellar biosynthesis protein FlhB [Spirochaetia bacterium]|nr:flagellar biosynthesis protein FlhB [Spirochaetales bacterium]HRY80256.1 flagellar biosynthesis protein FlhB [Spirochaetia bacterium]